MELTGMDSAGMAPARRNRADLATWAVALDDAAFARALAALGALAALAPAHLASAFTPGSGWQMEILARLLADAPDPATGRLPWRAPDAPAHGQTAPRLRIAHTGRERATAVAAPDAHLLSITWAALTEPDGDQPAPWPGPPRLALDPDLPDAPGALPVHAWLAPWLPARTASTMARPPASFDLPQTSGAAPPEASAFEPADRFAMASRAPPEATPPPASGGAALESLPRQPAQQPAPATPRYVHADSRWADDPAVPCSAYVVGRAVEVAVDIDARRLDSTVASVPFPEEWLPPAEQHELQVVLHEPRQFDQPMLATITLPRSGRSTTAMFGFTPRAAGAFEARLSILHRGRVLQTLLLRTQVLSGRSEGLLQGPGITLDEETRVRQDWSDLNSRRQFDLAMVLNHTPAGEPLATAVAGSRAWATSLDGIAEPVKDINALISNVALSVADYDAGLDQGENPALFTRLARIGSELYSLLYRDQLRQLASDGFDVGDAAVTHIQLVSTRQDAIVPLEFMYDYNAPNPGAQLCPQHREALQGGCCPDGCARTADPRGYVCPMGFWGLKKVIERHMYDAAASGASAAANAPPLIVQVEAVAGRDHLDLSAGALVGHSEQVKPAQVKPLLARLKKKFRRATPVARNWNDWSDHVQAARPTLLITFPHNEGRRPDVQLEIGGDKLYTLDLLPQYVHAGDGPPPMVFLLGCDVAGAAQDFAGHIRYFREAGAAVVISTIATVFGAHAVRVGDAIVAGLLATDPSQPARIGELIRDAKRAALLNSLPMALCVVAFGDADWRL